MPQILLVDNLSIGNIFLWVGKIPRMVRGEFLRKYVKWDKVNIENFKIVETFQNYTYKQEITLKLLS